MRFLILSLAMTAAGAAFAADSRPLPPERCRALAALFAEAIGREPVVAAAETRLAHLPYADHVPDGRACVLSAEATGRKAAARAGAALGRLVFRLRDAGWQDDGDLTADGGDSPQTGLRRGEARLAFFIEDRPAPACRDLGPQDRCKAPDGAHAWVFRAAAYAR